MLLGFNQVENSQASADIPGSFDGNGSVMPLSSSLRPSNELPSDCMDYMTEFAGMRALTVYTWNGF